ncbi:MAG TPA: c-type cytochrome [Allosphingosinicella sp.]|jgi:cytochrome c oxidase subunit 2
MRRPFLAPLLLLGGCSGLQTVGGREGRDAALINDLFTTFCIVTALFFAAVMAFLVAAYWRRRGHSEDGMPDALQVPSREGRLRVALLLWAGAVTGGLMALAVASYFTDRSLAFPNPDNRPVVSIEVTGNQWWWDVQYHFQDPSKNFRTANEIHLPVGMPAMIYLKANDVIHSFWVPNLAGKQDLIPGRVNDIVLVPTRIGRYRGQCAEYCGLQHAHMALDVTVETPRDFGRWLAHQTQPATTPTTPEAIAGYQFFNNRQCSSCHAVAGTPASATVAPDLTHLMSRRSIAAGALPNGTGPLHAWVADPQGVKPGSNMPYIGLNADELHNVVAYLETLK